MATNTISQRIALEGAEEIKRILTDLGGVGEKAFAQIQAAAGQATQSLEKISGAVARVERSVASVGTTARGFGNAVGSLGGEFNKFEQALTRTVRNVSLFTAGVSAAVVGLAAFIRSGINAGDNIDEQAQALGLGTQAYQELGFAAAEAGVKQGQFASGMRFFSQQIEKASQDGAKSTVKFLDDISKNFDDWGGRIKVVGNDTTETFSVIRQAAKNLQADLAAQGISRPLFQLEEGLRKLATGTAAQRAEFETLGRVSLPTAADGLDKLRGGTEKAFAELQKLLPQFKRNADGSIDLSDALLTVADQFQKLPDGTRKTATAMAFFGRAAGPALIPLLNQGRAGITELREEMRLLGLTLSEDQIKASSAAARAFEFLGAAATNVKNQIGAAFAPLARTVAGGLLKFITDNQTAINRFAEDLNARATPYVKAFFDLLSGKENTTAAGQQLTELQGKAIAFGETMRGVGTVIVQAFTIILSVLDQVATGFNAIFGTSLTGAELGIILIITKIVGGFTLLLAAIKLIGAAFTAFNAGLLLIASTGGLVINALRLIGVALVALVGWPALIVAGLAAAAVAIVVYWEEIKAGATAAFNWIVEKAKAGWEAVKAFFSQKIDGAWKWISDAFDAVANSVKTKLDELIKYITDKFKPVTDLLNKAFNSPDRPAEGQKPPRLSDGPLTEAFSDRRRDNAEDIAENTKTISVEEGKIAGEVQKTNTAYEQLTNQHKTIEIEQGKVVTGAESLLKTSQGVSKEWDRILESIRQVNIINGKAQPPEPQQEPFERPPIGAGELTESFSDSRRNPALGELETSPVVEQVRASIEQIKLLVEEANTVIATLAARVAENITFSFGLIGPAVDAAMASLTERVTAGGEAIGQALQAPFQSAAAGIQGVMEGLGSLIATTFASLNEAVAAAASQVESAIASIIASLEAAVAQAQALAAAAASAGSGGGGGSSDGFAHGGYTGDGGKYQPAGIVHRGEHVQPQNVVRQPGVLAFLEELRRSGGDLNGVMRRFLRGFSTGGMVDGMRQSLSAAMIPGYASGGLVGDMPAGHIAVDLTTNMGTATVMARPDVARELERWATMSRLSSAGRSPRGG